MEPLAFTNKSDADNQLTVAVDVDDGLWEECPNGVRISVSDVKAVGSYNSFFECSFWMTREEAAHLRDWLNRYLNS